MCVGRSLQPVATAGNEQPLCAASKRQQCLSCRPYPSRQGIPVATYALHPTQLTRRRKRRANRAPVRSHLGIAGAADAGRRGPTAPYSPQPVRRRPPVVHRKTNEPVLEALEPLNPSNGTPPRADSAAGRPAAAAQKYYHPVVFEEKADEADDSDDGGDSDDGAQDDGDDGEAAGRAPVAAPPSVCAVGMTRKARELF